MSSNPVPRITYHETRTRLPSITPSTFSIDESSVEYIDSDEDFSSQLNQNVHQTWKIREQKKMNNDDDDKHNDKKEQGKVVRGLKKMLNKFLYVDVPTTDINHTNDNLDEKSAYVTWLVGM